MMLPLSYTAVTSTVGHRRVIADLIAVVTLNVSVLFSPTVTGRSAPSVRRTGSRTAHAPRAARTGEEAGTGWWRPAQTPRARRAEPARRHAAPGFRPRRPSRSLAAVEVAQAVVELVVDRRVQRHRVVVVQRRRVGAGAVDRHDAERLARVAGA